MTITRHLPSKVLSDIVEHDGRIYLAGQVADNLDQDVRGQTKEILATIDRLLASVGSDKSHILSANIWLADIRTRSEMNEAWIEWADPAHLPARATVEAKLGDPRMLVEIMLVAAKK